MVAYVTTHSTLSEGNSNNDAEQVKRLQIKLNYFYHSYISVDGYFGDITEEYVEKFQADCSLTVDGIVGPQTWSALEEIVPYSYIQHSTLSKGSNNNASEVKYLQARLNELQRQGKSGTATIAVDGKFGPQTEARVKEFQSGFGLSVDGIVGSKTWAVLEDAAVKN